MNFWTLAAIPYTLGACIVACFIRLGIAHSVEEIEDHRFRHGPSKRWQRALVEWGIRNGDHGMALASIVAALSWPWIVIHTLLELLWFKRGAKREAGLAPCAPLEPEWCSTVGTEASYRPQETCPEIQDPILWFHFNFFDHLVAQRCHRPCERHPGARPGCLFNFPMVDQYCEEECE